MIMKCVVVGGSGALGRALVKSLLSKGANVTTIDLSPNNEATSSVTISKPLTDCTNLEAASKEARSHGPFNAVFCVAGGWQGGGAASDSFIGSSLAMWEMNVISATLAASLAPSLMEGGLLVFTSAKASLSSTPGMVGYGMAKAATNHLISSLAASGSGIPASCTVLGVLPETLDTEANRKAMPKADFSTWTPLSVLADKMCEWVINPSTRQKTGSLIVVETCSQGTNLHVAN